MTPIFRYSALMERNDISARIVAGAVTTGADLQAILAGADAALYRVKSAGRNCVHQ